MESNITAKNAFFIKEPTQYMMKKTFITLILMIWTLASFAQTANPQITFANKKTQEVDTLTAGSAVSAEAPLEITCNANVDCPSNYTYKLEWRIFKENDGEDKPALTRFDDVITYNLVNDGTFCIQLYLSFYDVYGNEQQAEIEPMKITISASSLTCPDFISPNGDEQNDYLTVTCKSLVKVKGAIFNRWAQRIKVLDLDSFNEPDPSHEGRYRIWDGKSNGKYVADGVYFINLDCYGADGIHYKIKKAINVLKGYRENENSVTEN